MNSVEVSHWKNKNLFSLKLIIRGENSRLLLTRFNTLLDGEYYTTPSIGNNFVELVKSRENEWSSVVPEIKSLAEKNGFFFREISNG